ncbi:MAG: hypothetical protein ACYC97_02200, partial [Metallibacterium sp.]
MSTSVPPVIVKSNAPPSDSSGAAMALTARAVKSGEHRRIARDARNDLLFRGTLLVCALLVLAAL